MFGFEMEKKKIAEGILDSLKKEMQFLLDEYARLSNAAIEAPGRMQSRYDSSKEELSYEANRMQRRMSVLEHTIREVTSFIPTMQKNDSVGPGALVTVQSTGKKLVFLILPFGEGEEVASTLVLSPQSPIFRDMRGKKEGELFSFRGTTYTIESIE